METLTDEVFEPATYSATDLATLTETFAQRDDVLTTSADAHTTITLVALMRRTYSSDGVLWGEKVSQAELVRRFGKRFDPKGNEVDRVSKGRMSNAYRLATEGSLAEMFDGSDDIVGALITYLAYRRDVGRGVSIETLYNEEFGSDGASKGWTLAGAVSTLLAKCAKEGIPFDAIIDELDRQELARQHADK